MQENEFEKQVQQKMDDLKLDPSAAVWQKIESQIKKEKPRRRILILIPILLTFILYGGYVYLNKDHNKIESDKQNQPQSQASQNKNTITHNTPRTKQNIDSITLSQAVQEKQIVDSPDKSNGSVQRRRVNAVLKINIKNNDITDVKEPAAEKQITDVSTAIAETISNDKLKTDLKNIEQEKAIVVQESKSNRTTLKPEEMKKPNENDSVAKVLEIEKNNSFTEENIASAVTKKSSTKNKKWNWGASFSIGLSGMSNSFFGNLLGDEQKSIFDQNSPTGSVGGSFNQVAAPSKIEPALAFITGVVAEKYLSKKIILTTGLNYKLFTTTNRVGVDSSAFYRASSAVNSYSNHYQYLELPVGINWQIADLKRSKLYINTGVSISQLVSAKALQFNNSTRLYYHNNSLFNKTQFGFNTGLDIAFMSKEKRSIVIGPYLNYSINKIASQGYNHHHFTFIGLRTQIIFGKK